MARCRWPQITRSTCGEVRIFRTTSNWLWVSSETTSGQRSGILTSTPGGAHAIGSGASRSLRSSPVKIAVTPGSASAADVSIETMFACASVERTIDM